MKGVLAMLKSPCMDCPDRQLGCHSDCEKYIYFQNRHKEEKARISEAKIADGEYWAVRKYSKERAMKARGERKG